MRNKNRCFLILSLLLTISVCLSTTAQIELEAVGTYDSGLIDESAAEIVTYDPETQRVFVVNASAGNVDVLDISNPSVPTLMFTIEVSMDGGAANCVAFHNGVLAVAVADKNEQDLGTVAFYDAFGKIISKVKVGALPDMLTFTPDGKYILVANEGQPSDDYSVDPEGSISIIDLQPYKNSTGSISQDDVKTADFKKFNPLKDTLIESGVRIFGPGATVAEDLEPEYIAVSADSTKAWAILQENNALAVLDISNAEITDLLPLGVKDHNIHPIDASNRDDKINIQTWPVHGFYMPDAIDTIQYNGLDFIISANEGDSRDYDSYSEETRVKDLTLDPIAYPNAADLQKNENLGRLKTTTANGDIDGDGDIDQIYSYGARSFSIWSAKGELIYDSGDDIEQLTALNIPESFNSQGTSESFDSRSDDKGPEPEGVEVGIINGKTYAFIGLERVGGIVVYEVTDPYNPSFVQYINNSPIDIAPEGLVFIPAEESPNGSPLLVVGNEYSGTTTVFHIHMDGVPPSYTYFLDVSKGINMVSVPLKPVEQMTARDLMNKLDATLVIRYNKKNGYYQGYTANYPNSGFAIEGGQGYIVNAKTAQVVPFIGAPWTNEPSVETPSAPSTVVAETWAFMIEANLGYMSNLTLSVRNLRTGLESQMNSSVSNFTKQTVWTDLSRRSVVNVNDELEIQIHDSVGQLIGTLKHQVSTSDIERAFIQVNVKTSDILPSQTQLLANYPNPFNPETWIPYQLQNDADTTIRIYDVDGKLVRNLDLGFQTAGYYHNQSRAAYWNGRNNLGEQVVSGVYFYQLESDDYIQTRKLVILK